MMLESLVLFELTVQLEHLSTSEEGSPLGVIFTLFTRRETEHHDAGGQVTQEEAGSHSTGPHIIRR
jgi:hypothetical protein